MGVHVFYYMCYMFYFIENSYLCNYADENRLYVFDCNMNVVKEKLYKDFEVLDKWFYDNYMALNPGKCNFMFLGSNLLVVEIFVYESFKLKHTSVNKILGVIIDRELKFDRHVKHICKKAGNKLNALTRMVNILNSFQKNTLFKSFIKGRFNYCPLLWKFCSRSSNSLINKIHERALSLTSETNDIPFNELLSINNEVLIHNKNIQILLIEVYKNLNRLSPPMFDLFTARDNIYNLRNFREICCEEKKTILYGYIQGSSAIGITSV